MPKLLKNLWREIRPDALWDLVKYMLITGVSLLAVIAYRLVAVLRELPHDRVVDLAIFVGAFTLIVGAYALTRYRDSQLLQERTAPLIAESKQLVKEVRAGIEESKRWPFGAPDATPPEKRIVVTATPEVLTNFFKGHTAAQGEKLVSPYIGKWLRVAVIVNDVTLSSYDAALHAELKDMVSVTMHFDRAVWGEWVEIISRGEQVNVIGKIDYVNEYKLRLTHCELIDASPDA